MQIGHVKGLLSAGLIVQFREELADILKRPRSSGGRQGREARDGTRRTQTSESDRSSISRCVCRGVTRREGVLFEHLS